ncbi:hypothetical protein KC19_5G122000 [Ceratodon purpureus]|uniref:GTD-binding domain-containing protein n=1 Tax=Ceratodon purpureus TaxID=3225 RepID=A0A8T0I0J6_CERPU|nr:hypothetical protein KC19_5G122000 [Ceratodon purpureus]
MERSLRQRENRLDWKPNLFVQSFRGVFEALAVLIFCLLHYVVVRVLRRSGLSTPCSCPAPLRKRFIPSNLGDSFGLEENCGVDQLDTSSRTAGLGGFAGLRSRVGGVASRIAMAESRCRGGGDEGCTGYSTPAEDLTEREQREIDHDQDVKDRELFEALQSERETLAVLYSELEQERSCAASAASEALAMISRLQEEKAAVQLEARQFQRMVLEKAMYDQEAIEALNELLVSREEEKLALEEEIRACREKLDSVMREERRQSLIPKEEVDDLSRVSLHSPILTESPILIEKERIITTPGAARDEQPKCVDKFSTTKSQVLTALVQDGQLGLGRKFGKCEEREEEKPEFPGFVSLRRRWGSQEVSLKTLEQTKEERQIEERRIEERRISVLEYVMKFEQQQQGVRLPVRMQSVTRLPKSAEEPRSKTQSVDMDESTSSITKDEPTSRVLTRDDSLRRRLFEEEDCGGEQKPKAPSSEESLDDGDRCEECPSGISANGNELMDSKVCRGTDNADECIEKALFVHDVYEVQKSPYEVLAPIMGDGEMQPATPSDRLGKPDLPTFEMDEDSPDCLCLVHPPNLHNETEEDSGKDLEWEDLQGKVRYKSLRVSKSLRIRDNSRPEVDDEVQQLTQRLQALEADKYFMKQTIESLRRENGEMKLLQDLAQQFRELGGAEQQELWPRKLPLNMQFQGLMSFARLRNNAQAHFNKLGQTCLNGTETTEPQAERSVGLGRLLQQSPERLRGRRLIRSSSWKAEEIIPSTALSCKKERWPF